MVAKFTQGNEKLDDVIKWAEKECCAPDAGDGADAQVADLDPRQTVGNRRGRTCS
jgi:hypothetical protein